MSDTSGGPGWWQASDGKWYPPEQQPGGTPPAPGGQQPAGQQPAGGATTVDIGKALSYGWNGFVQNIGVIIVLVLVIFAVQIGFNIVGQALDSVFLSLVLSAIGFVITLMISVGLIRAALAIVDGQKPELNMLFQGAHIGSYFVAALLVGLMFIVGFALCIIPGLLVLFFTFFYGYFIVDKNMGPTEGISASFNLVKNNAGQLLGFLLVSMLLVMVTCGLAWPIAWIAGAYVYKTMLGEPVAELT
ncbi:MAG: hypothetical protein OES57_09350 [Acidimicrobiia bacterium]|nr:hypothetical protein [Acidimicrobiia bacterium]